MIRGLAVAVCLGSLSAFACVNGTHEIAPPTPEAKMLVAARKALNEKKYQDAYDMADAAIQSGGAKGRQLAWAVRVKGEALVRLDRSAEALPLLQQVLQAFNDDAVFLSRLAQAEIQNGKEKEGGDRLEQLFTDKMLPDGAAWFWLAKARQAKGATDPALAAAHQAARMNKGDAASMQLVKDLRAKVKTM